MTTTQQGPDTFPLRAVIGDFHEALKRGDREQAMAAAREIERRQQAGTASDWADATPSMSPVVALALRYAQGLAGDIPTWIYKSGSRGQQDAQQEQDLATQGAEKALAGVGTGTGAQDAYKLGDVTKLLATFTPMIEGGAGVLKNVAAAAGRTMAKNPALGELAPGIQRALQYILKAPPGLADAAREITPGADPLADIAMAGKRAGATDVALHADQYAAMRNLRLPPEAPDMGPIVEPPAPGTPANYTPMNLTASLEQRLAAGGKIAKAARKALIDRGVPAKTAEQLLQPADATANPFGFTPDELKIAQGGKFVQLRGGLAARNAYNLAISHGLSPELANEAAARAAAFAREGAASGATGGLAVLGLPDRQRP